MREKHTKHKLATRKRNSGTVSSVYPVLPRGLKATCEKDVPHEWTIAHFNENLPPVLSTPAMIGMMEVAAARAVQSSLPPGMITVGTRIEVDHLKAVPAGSHVTATAILEKTKGRFLQFAVEAQSGNHVIGRGRVFRAVVEPRGFSQKADNQGSNERREVSRGKRGGMAE